MSQKQDILSLLNDGAKTQGQLAEAIYGDKKHMPNTYSVLMSLVESGAVTSPATSPAILIIEIFGMFIGRLEYLSDYFPALQKSKAAL